MFEPSHTLALCQPALTCLPGNTTILFEATAGIDSRQPYAPAPVDIDIFKSFNHHYGYGRGDEILVVACRILTTVVRELAGSEGFVGHVGGDDFASLLKMSGARQSMPSFQAGIPTNTRLTRA